MPNEILARHAGNPILSPSDVEPSHPGSEIISVINAGAAQVGNKIVLLLRVAERFVPSAKGAIKIPHLAVSRGKTEMSATMLSLRDQRYDFSDPRVVYTRDKPHTIVALTSLSHVRLAWSDDGLHFKVEKHPWLFPSGREEAWGCEDPRLTKIGETYWVNFTAVSDLGIATALASTRSFQKVKRHGIIFAPANRDVVTFPEKVRGKYAAFHRPMPAYIGGQNIWYADSPNLLQWGNHRLVAAPRPGLWDEKRIGGGAPPLRTKEGWLAVYHGVDKKERYALGALLTDLKEPWKVLCRSRQPLLAPQAPYERHGLFPNVCFTCGSVPRQGELWVYYGVADRALAVATAPLKFILQSLA